MEPERVEASKSGYWNWIASAQPPPTTHHQDSLKGSAMRPFTIQEGLEVLRRGVGIALVRYDQQGVLRISKQGLGFAVQVQWNDRPPEDLSFLEENHLLVWWSHVVGEGLL